MDAVNMYRDDHRAVAVVALDRPRQQDRGQRVTVLTPPVSYDDGRD